MDQGSGSQNTFRLVLGIVILCMLVIIHICCRQNRRRSPWPLTCCVLGTRQQGTWNRCRWCRIADTTAGGTGITLFGVAELIQRDDAAALTRGTSGATLPLCPTLFAHLCTGIGIVFTSSIMGHAECNEQPGGCLLARIVCIPNGCNSPPVRSGSAGVCQIALQ